ncbi:MAG: tRNA (adenosine(37)-N6)-threonylcarbamoyltransferase complex ATPase subunit type 1 TsaE [Panacagrimonas sp.]
MELKLDDAEATAALGAQLAPYLLAAGGGVVFLRGDLGAGKTTLARGLLRHAGIEGTLRSPTYTLMEPYVAGGQAFLHLDLYRLADPEEVENLGLRDYPTDSTLWLVEWPERGLPHLPAPDLCVDLEHRDGARAARLSGPLAGSIAAEIGP